MLDTKILSSFDFSFISNSLLQKPSVNPSCIWDTKESHGSYRPKNELNLNGFHLLREIFYL